MGKEALEDGVVGGMTRNPRAVDARRVFACESERRIGGIEDVGRDEEVVASGKDGEGNHF